MIDADGLAEVIQGLNGCLRHTEYLLINCTHQFPDASSLRALQNELCENIEKLKKLDESKA